MRDLVMDYLSDNLSRRGFLKQVTAAGFSAVAAHEILRSLRPLTARAAEPGTDTTGYKTVEGTGGDILVEQWAAAGVEFVTIGNSSHLRPVYDAFLDRTDIHPILHVQPACKLRISCRHPLRFKHTNPCRQVTRNSRVGRSRATRASRPSPLNFNPPLRWLP